MEKMNGQTLDIVKDNISKLKQIFPEVFNEDKVDLEKLGEILGDYRDNNTQRYNFSWPEKSKSIRIAQTPSTGTLRPCKKESKNWDKTENLYIEGDNLEVLKLLQKSYYSKVKMIYIDPPYNTGNDFVYKDDYKDNVENYLAITGQKDEEGNKLTTNTESSGRYHSNWLNMMYPRLKLARNLLKDDGVIFISIDEKEVDNLKKICNEVFGEENITGEIIWKNSSKNDQAFISIQHEYIISYVKVKSLTNGQWKEKKEGLDEIYKAFDSFRKKSGNNWNEIHKEALKWYKQFPQSNPIYSSKHYSWMDERGVYFPADISGPHFGQYRYDVIHPITGKICKEPASGWRYPEETMRQRIKENLVHFGKDQMTIPNNKTYLKNTEFQSLTSVKYRDGRVASKKLNELLGGNYFTNPKDIDLINILSKAIGLNKDEIVLDFFSGSSTTAHAVMQLNAEDNEKRKFIMVQLPETIGEKEEAYKAGYKNICEIGKERIRRAGEKIKEENKDKKGIEDLDIGFKVFKLDSSNINKWNSSYNQDLKANILSSTENIKKDRTEEDVLYEILLKYGIDLNMPIEEHLINGKKIFSIGFGAILVCLDNEITLDVVEGIGKLKEKLQPEICRVVFMDNGFKSDSVKTNAVQILKRYNIEDVKSI